LDRVKIDFVEADFTSDNTNGFAPLTVNFTDRSANSPSGWKWDFDNDGKIDTTVQNPSHIYKTAGVYTVKLLVSKTGSSDSLIKTSYITVKEPVKADFSSNEVIGKKPLTIHFTDQTIGNPTSWQWDFNNDGVFETYNQNPTYTFINEGVYTIKLKVQKPGSTDSIIKTNYITVVTPVQAQFAANNTVGTAPFSVTFNNYSSGSPTSWQWDFNNDGIVDATSMNPTYTYSAIGVYTVKLIALKEGSADTLIRTNYIMVDRPSDISIVTGNAAIIISPNPTSGLINIQMPDLKAGSISIEIIDITGKNAHFGILTFNHGFSTDISGLPAGPYYIRIISKEKVFASKIIKK